MSKRQLTDAFKEFDDNKKEEINEPHKASQEATEAPQSHSNEDHKESGTLTVEEVKNELLVAYKEKVSRKRVEDTHIRSTFLFDKELSKRLDKLSKGKRGFKTMFINKAIETLLDELEK